jgi:hypothetical protein
MITWRERRLLKEQNAQDCYAASPFYGLARVPSLSLSLSLSLSDTHRQTDRQTHTHTHTLENQLPLSEYAAN